MNFEEHAAKPLLAAAGIAVPESMLAVTPADAAAAAEKIGPCVVKDTTPCARLVSLSPLGPTWPRNKAE